MNQIILAISKIYYNINIYIYFLSGEFIKKLFPGLDASKAVGTDQSQANAETLALLSGI